MAKQSKRGGWIFILIALAVIIVVILKESRSTLVWIEDYQAGIQQAREQNKPALVLFVSSNPKYSNNCQRMEKEVHTKLGVKKYISDNFVAIRIIDNKNRQLAQKYKINIYPTHVIVLPTEDKFTAIEGYLTSDAFSFRLNQSLERLKRK